MALDQHWIVTLALVVSSLIAVISNVLLLVVFFRRRGLRTISNRFVINLLITNLLSSVFLVPLLIIDSKNPDEPLIDDVTTEYDLINSTMDTILDKVILEEQISSGGEILEEIHLERMADLPSQRGSKSQAKIDSRILCYFAQATANLICTASIFSILLIGIDQYFAVVHPLRYHFYMDKFRSSALIASCWLTSLAVAILDVLIMTDCNFWRFCAETKEGTEVRSSMRIAFSFVYFFVVIVAPFLTICAIYVCIYTAAHENSERMRKSNSGNPQISPLKTQKRVEEVEIEDEGGKRGIPKVHSAPNFSSLNSVVVVGEDRAGLDEIPQPIRVSRSCSDRISHKNIIISLKCRISNASVFKYREETRAAKISLLVIFMVLICYTPYGLAVLLNTELYKAKLPHFFNYIALMLLVISNTISPFLFAYRSRRVQRELLKFLRVIPSNVKNPENPLKNFQKSPDSAQKEDNEVSRPFIENNFEIPKVVVTFKSDNNNKKSILKRVCSKNWGNYKKCNFITVPDSCLDARGSFSSASTQISSEE